jgi:hypothetical protein
MKCGILKEGEELDNKTLKQYLEMYKQPLSKDSVEAIVKLSDISEEKKKRKDKKKKAKTEEAGKNSEKKGKKKASKFSKAPQHRLLGNMPEALVGWSSVLQP